MKKSILLLITLMLNLCISAQKNNDTPIYLDALACSKQGNQFDIELSLDLSECKLKQGSSIYLYPVLVVNLGDSIHLSQIIINSKSAHQAYKRHPKHFRYRDASVVHQLKKKAKTLNYINSLPYRKGLHNAQLLIYKAECRCGDIHNKTLILRDKINPEIVSKTGRGLRSNKTNRRQMIISSHDSIDLEVVEYHPSEELVKERFEHGEVYLNFKQGKHEILYDYKDNSSKLKQVADFFNRVVRDQDIEIKNIRITGYCSIEGSYGRNIQLSHDRAKSFFNWIRYRYPELSDRFSAIDWKGEDWLKLTKMIEDSDYSWKYSALDIIHRYGVFEGRERFLMQIQGGRPYREMYKELFPLLRRVTFHIDYVVRPFNIEDSQTVIASNPQKLSIFEMYALAESYGRGSKQFYETVNKAAEVYPKDLIAINNAAAFALSRGDYEKARSLLIEAPDDADKFNNLGVLFALKKDYSQALYWFKKAANEGLAEAKKNISSIKHRLEAQNKIENNKPREVRIPF